MWIAVLEEAHATAMALADRRVASGHDHVVATRGEGRLDVSVTWRGRRATIRALLGGAAVKTRLRAGYGEEELLEALRRAYVAVVVRAPYSPAARCERRARVEAERIRALEGHGHYSLPPTWWEQFLGFLSRQGGRGRSSVES